MGRTLNQEHTHTEVDLDTGELKRIVTDDYKGSIDQEPDYIKIYIGTQLSLNNLSPNLAPLVMAIAPFMTYANDSHYTHMVSMNEAVYESMAHYMGVSYSRAKHYRQILEDAHIIIPMYKQVEKDGVITRKRKRGQYFVNPWVVAKGSWKDVKKLRQNIDFVKGQASYCIEDELGERHIQVGLPVKEVSEGEQYTIEDYLTEGGSK